MAAASSPNRRERKGGGRTRRKRGSGGRRRIRTGAAAGASGRARHVGHPQRAVELGDLGFLLRNLLSNVHQ